MQARTQRRFGQVRTEYLVAGVVCTLLLMIMAWALYVQFTHTPRQHRIAGGTGIQKPSAPSVPTAPAPRPAETASAVPTPAPVPAPVEPQSGTLPKEWTSLAMGDAAGKGTSSHDADGWTITAGGSDIWGNSDNGSYVYQTISGNRTMIVKVSSLTRTDEWVKAGLMMRESNAANAAHVSIVATSSAVLFMARYNTDGLTMDLGQAAIPLPESNNPTWIKLVRSGNSFAGYYATMQQSPGDADWKQLGSVTTCNLPGDCLGGLAVTSHVANTLCTAKFGDVSLHESVALAAAPAPAPTPEPVPTPTPEPAAVVPTPGVESVLVDNVFDDLKVGTRPSGDVWTFGTQGGQVNAQAALGLEGKALRLNDTNRTGNVWTKQTFPEQKGDVIVEYMMRFSQTTDGFGMDLMDGDTVVARVETSHAQLAAQKGDNAWQAMEKVKESVWYKIRIDAHVEAGTYDVTIDGQKRGSDIPFWHKPEKIDAWCAGTSVPFTGGLLLKNVKVTAKP